MKGLVIAGGNSSRMTTDKAMLNYFGQPQWRHVYNLLQAHCDEVFVSVHQHNPEINAPQIIDLPQYANAGPIASIISAFEKHKGPWFVLAIDYPYFSELELNNLLSQHKTQHLSSVMRHHTSSFYEPFIGIYTSDFYANAKTLIDEEEFSLQNIYKQVQVNAVKPINETALTSVDSPEEYRKAKLWADAQAQTSSVRIIKNTVSSIETKDDVLAVEEPLEISIATNINGIKSSRNIAVTMRTPGNDEELAIGFLFTEGIIHSANEVAYLQSKGHNKICVFLVENVQPNLQNTERNFYTTSSCGVCGKASIEAIRTKLPENIQHQSAEINSEILSKIYTEINSYQSVFAQTGGIHASALFTAVGTLKSIREDVGRHNALDKLIGVQLLTKQIINPSDILLLSGRASFELIQKAAMAQIQIVASIGAPSSLAVQLAEEVGIKLIGFLKGERFNVYT
jgi:FdhD protein